MDHPIGISNKSHQQSASSSSTWTFPTATATATVSDEISLFLQQILLRSSSPTPHSSPPSVFSDLTCSIRAFTPLTHGNVPDEISAVPSSHVLHATDHSLNDEFDSQTEEAFVEQLPTNPNPRTSSKRSRASEVHNLSEKRRRSRINEKMKALQNLIPNSNKTDKASMLDEAIEYLKQLQLQVQMLSMRNGLSLHPMNLPGSLQYLQLSHLRMDFAEQSRPLSPDQERPNQVFLSFPDQKAASNSIHPFMSDIARTNAETPFELVPPVQPHIVPFYLSEPSKEICRDVILDNQVDVRQTETTPFVSRPYNIPAAHLQELQNCVSVEPCIVEGNGSDLLLNTPEHSHVFPSLSNGIDTGRPTETTKLQP